MPSLAAASGFVYIGEVTLNVGVTLRLSYEYGNIGMIVVSFMRVLPITRTPWGPSDVRCCGPVWCVRGAARQGRDVIYPLGR